MRIDIITGLPALLESPLNDSIVKRSQTKGIVTIAVHDLRDYSDSKHRNIDDYAFGGGAGMVMSPEPIARCIDALSEKRRYDAVIYTTPDGATFDQKRANRLSTKENIIILCGHYKGVDQRIRDKYITSELSIGDYVLSGGELAAAVITDAVVRLLPGVLNDETSALTDTFQDDLLAPPVYTRPAEWRGMEVPPVLISGNGPAIEEWRMEKAMERTKIRRPDLWEKFNQQGDS